MGETAAQGEMTAARVYPCPFSPEIPKTGRGRRVGGRLEGLMATWFNWSPLSPLIERYVDDGTRDLCTAEISIEETGDFIVGLVGTKHRIELIRVATLD